MPFRKQKTRDPERFPRWGFVLLALAAVALSIWLVAAFSERFANAFNRTVGAFVRSALAHLTSWLPFSLAEFLLYSLPLWLVLLVVIGARRHCGSWRAVLVYLGAILSAFSLLLSMFVFGFGTGYRTTTLDRRLDLAPTEVNAETLEATAERLVTELNALAPSVTYGEDGFSEMPYDLSGLNDKLLAAYLPVCEKYDFVQKLNSRVKPVLASKAMSYTHTTGVYAYFTGEANLNMHFPDYTLPYTAAHELAHQRGIARENEANFVAFLVCVGSEDDYLRYSAYLNLYEYVANALWRADRDRYRAVLATLDERVVGELRAYSAFFETYRNSRASEVSDAVNDAYLKLNGSEAGSESYGLVVELAVAYYAP